MEEMDVGALYKLAIRRKKLASCNRKRSVFSGFQLLLGNSGLVRTASGLNTVIYSMVIFLSCSKRRRH